MLRKQYKKEPFRALSYIHFFALRLRMIITVNKAATAMTVSIGISQNWGGRLCTISVCSSVALEVVSISSSAFC